MLDETITRYIYESVSWNCAITNDHQGVDKYNYTWFKVS